MRISENSSTRMAKSLLSHPRIRIRVLTQREQLFLAEETVTTRDRERNDDAIANLKVSHFATNFHDLAHELMTKNIATLHRGNETVIEVQVGAADRRRRDLHDRVALVEDLWIRNLLDAQRGFTIPTVGFHRSLYLPSDP